MYIKRFFKSIFDYIARSDIILWILILVISGYSMILIRSVSKGTGVTFDRTQFLAIMLGMLGAIIITVIDYADIARLWPAIAIFSVGIMIYTIFTGTAVTGSGGVDARAWIKIFGRSFQPSELVKIMFLITFSKHLCALKERELLKVPLHVILLFFHAIIPFLLCVSQGDAGAGIIFIAMFLFMSFAAGIQLRYFVILFTGLVVSIPLIWQYFLKPYQKRRITSVYNLDTDPTVAYNDGFQQYQARISIGSGGFKGSGIGNGSRVASNAVVVQESDFIYTVAGEELGFIGCVLIIVLLLLLMIKITHTASTARDDMGKYICFGYLGLIAVQSIVNIGMNLALLPVMGITLPFFSSGGTSAMCLYFGIGLVQSVYMRRKEASGSKLIRKTTMKFTYKQMKNL